VEIVSPENGATILISQTVNLEGIAYDADSGSMPDDRLLWRSNVDGVLGEGDQLSTAELTAGQHTITFEADDGAGGTAADAVQIVVLNHPGQMPVPPDGLVAGPDVVELDLLYQADAQRIFIENQNTKASIAWQATVSDQWVQISDTSGATPDSLTVALGSGGVPAGSSATVTFVSPDAPNQSETVQIRVIRTRALFLPIVLR
jgi:hypothetical protein